MTQGSAAETARRPVGEKRAIGRMLWAHARTAPASILLSIITIVTATICGTLLAAAPPHGVTYRTWGVGVGPLIQQGHWWSPLTALFIPSDPFELVLGVVLVLVFLGTAEWLMGTARAVVAFLVCGILGAVSGVLVQWLGSLVHAWWASQLTFEITLDPSIGLAGAVMAASVYATAVWRRRLRLLVFALLLMLVLYDGDPQNGYRLAAALFGLWLGTVFHPQPPADAGEKPARDERRTLLATVVVVSSLGPLVALVSQSQTGIFSYLGQIFQQSVPDRQDVIGRCLAGAAECHRQITLIDLYNAGSLGMTFVPILLLLVAAIGLLLGRRFALYLAVVVKLSLTVLGILALVSFARFSESGNASQYVLWAAAIVVPFGIAVILWLNRRHFPVLAPRSAVWDFLVSVLGALAVLLAIVIVVSIVNGSGFVPHAIQPLEILGNLPRRFIPAIFLRSITEAVIPGDDLTRFVYQWTGVVFWAVFSLSVIRLFLARATADRASR